MTYYPRTIEKELARAAKAFPAVLLTGPRRAGKTTLLQRLFPDATYVLVEDPDIIGRIRSDPRGFLDDLKPPVILDEIQNIPEVLGYCGRGLTQRRNSKVSGCLRDHRMHP